MENAIYYFTLLKYFAQKYFCISDMESGIYLNA